MHVTIVAARGRNQGLGHGEDVLGDEAPVPRALWPRTVRHGHLPCHGAQKHGVSALQEGEVKAEREADGEGRRRGRLLFLQGQRWGGRSWVVVDSPRRPADPAARGNGWRTLTVKIGTPAKPVSAANKRIKKPKRNTRGHCTGCTCFQRG